jgi:hypothetical protein
VQSKPWRNEFGILQRENARSARYSSTAQSYREQVKYDRYQRCLKEFRHSYFGPGLDLETFVDLLSHALSKMPGKRGPLHYAVMVRRDPEHFALLDRIAKEIDSQISNGPYPFPKVKFPTGRRYKHTSAPSGGVLLAQGQTQKIRSHRNNH